MIGKKKYKNKIKARTALRKLRKDKSNQLENRLYYCGTCKAWHITK